MSIGDNILMKPLVESLIGDQVMFVDKMKSVVFPGKILETRHNMLILTSAVITYHNYLHLCSLA